MAFDWLAITIGGEKTLGQSLQPAAKNTGVHFFPLTYPPSTHMYTQYNKVPFKKNGRVQCWRCTSAFQKMEELEKKQLSFFKAMIKSYCTGIINIPHSSAKIISLTRSKLYYPEEISLSLVIYSSCFLYFGMLYFVHYFITIITGLLVIVLTYMDCPGVTPIMNE